MIKQSLFTLFMAIVLVSCQDKTSKKIITESSGNINNLSLVIDNELWEGSVGEALRDVLAAPVDGLPWDEPLFTISQMPSQAFSGFSRKNRIVLKVEKGKPAAVKYANDAYAKPQTVVLISGETNPEIIAQLENNKETIVKTLKAEEIKERQRRIAKSPLDVSAIKERLGISIQAPSAYRIAKDEEGFFWLRKDISTGTTNIMLYELPQDYIKDNDSLIGQIVKLRDSIGKVHIPGPSEGSYMITEKAYSPFLFKTEIQGRETIETKGTWEVQGAFMAGPFINYIIKDEANDRLLVMEGFTFAPSVEKREYMFDLEAIIKSVKFE